MDFPSTLNSTYDLAPSLHPPHHEASVNNLSSTHKVVQHPNAARYPAITHLAVITAFLLPITLLPYVFARRQVSLLERQVKELGSRVRVLQEGLQTVSSEITTQKAHHKRSTALLRNLVQGTSDLQAQAQLTERNMNRLRGKAEEMEQNRSKLEKVVKTDIERLLDQSNRTR